MSPRPARVSARRGVHPRGVGPGVCQVCGAPVRFVVVIPTERSLAVQVREGRTRSLIPMDLDEPAEGVRPSHAMNLGRTVARHLAAGDEPGTEERPAMTHFATCPARAGRTA